MKSKLITGLAFGLASCIVGFAASALAEMTEWDETIHIFSQRDAYTTVICQETNHPGVCEMARNTRADEQSLEKLFLVCFMEDEEACKDYENIVDANRKIVAELQPVAKAFHATEPDDDFSYGPRKQDEDDERYGGP